MTASRSSASRMKHHRERRRQGTPCVIVELSQSERDALVVRGYLSEEDRDNGAAIKKAIESVISDLVFELQSETTERSLLAILLSVLIAAAERAAVQAEVARAKETVDLVRMARTVTRLDALEAEIEAVEKTDPATRH